MRISVAIFVLLACRNSFTGAPAQPPAEPKLTGIVHLRGVSRALLELPGRLGSISRPILRQREAAALRALAEINGFSFERVGDDQVRLVRTPHNGERR